MKTLLLLAAFTLSFTVAGCGKQDEAELAADRAAEAAEQVGQNDAQATNAEAAATSGGARKPAEKAIAAATLKGYIPSMQGYVAEEPDVVDMSMNGQVWSSAVQRFNKGDQHVTVSIMDWNFNEGLTAAYSMYTDGNFSIETGDGFTRAEKVNGFPGWINWDKKNNSGTIGTIVNDRIYVITEVQGGATVEDLRRIASGIDLAGIASAK